MKGGIKRDDTNKILKRNKSIYLSPCIHNVLKLQFNLSAKKHWVGLRIVSRLDRIRCNPSYNVKGKLSATVHLTKGEHFVRGGAFDYFLNP